MLDMSRVQCFWDIRQKFILKTKYICIRFYSSINSHTRNVLMLMLMLMYTICWIIIHGQALRLRLTMWFCDIIGTTVLQFNTFFLACINMCPY